MASYSITVLVLAFVIYLSLSIPTLARLLRGTKPDEISPEWLQSFSPSIYLPMERLLNTEDFAFLSRQPGFDLSLYRKLRKERLMIFRQYLDRMVTDFSRLHLAARLAIAESSVDHSDLMPALIALKMRFTVSVLFAEFRYWLCRLGLRSLSVRTLLQQMHELNAQWELVRASA